MKAVVSCDFILKYQTLSEWTGTAIQIFLFNNLFNF